MSLSHSAVLLSLLSVKELLRQRDRKNLPHAVEPASQCHSCRSPFATPLCPTIMPTTLTEETGPGPSPKRGVISAIELEGQSACAKLPETCFLVGLRMPNYTCGLVAVL